MAIIKRLIINVGKGLPWWNSGLRIHLPMQGTGAGALVGEDLTCHGATKPVCFNYCVCALEPTSHNY